MLVVSQRMFVDPMTVSVLLLAGLVLLMWRGGAWGALAEGEQPKSRALWGVPFLFVLWVNLDEWFILGLAVLACAV